MRMELHDALPSRALFCYQETKSGQPLDEWKNELKCKESARSVNFNPENYKPIWLQQSHAEKQIQSGRGIIPSGEEHVPGAKAYNHQQRSTNPLRLGLLEKERSSCGKNVYHDPPYDPIRMTFRKPVHHVDTPAVEVPFASHLRKERLHPDPNCLYYPLHAKANVSRAPSQVEPVSGQLSTRVEEMKTGLGRLNPARLESHMRGGVGPAEVEYFPKGKSRRHVFPHRSTPGARDPISGACKNSSQDREHTSSLYSVRKENDASPQISREGLHSKRERSFNVLTHEGQCNDVYKSGIKYRAEWRPADEVDKLLHNI